MIIIRDVSIKYADRKLFDQINLRIGLKDKIALVGNNGAGKSTLLKLISNEISPDDGAIELEGEPSIGYLKQNIIIDVENTVKAEAEKGLDVLMEVETKMLELEKELSNLENEIPSDDLLNAYSEYSERYQILGGDQAKLVVDEVLFGMGFKQKDFNRKIKEFSGGWQMRVELTKLLLSQPNYLLLDEPTNYLDIESILWLENYINNYPGCCIIISHDKRFLQNTTKRTVELVNGKLYDYDVGYGSFGEKKEQRQSLLSASIKNQQKVIEQKEKLIKRFMAKASKTSMAQSMQKQLDKMEVIESEEQDNSAIRIQFLPAKRLPSIVVDVQNLSKSYGDLNVLSKVDLRIERNERVSFVGQNGQGKTTLAKIICNELSASSGNCKLGDNVQLAFFAQDQTDYLDLNKTVLEEMFDDCPEEMRTKVRSILGAFLFSGEDVDKKVKVLSGGEKSRLAFAKLLLRPTNFLILDEPTSHLDIRSKDVLKQALDLFEGSILIVSHDRDFLSDLTSKTVEFRDGNLKSYLGDINYFLEKRKIDHLSQIEHRSNSSSTDSSVEEKEAPKKELSFEEKKTLKRKIQYAERDIEKYEQDMKKIELLMNEADFYNREDSTKIMQEYADLKKNLEEKTNEWESAVEELGE